MAAASLSLMDHSDVTWFEERLGNGVICFPASPLEGGKEKSVWECVLNVPACNVCLKVSQCKITE